jgi:hypothetical protein
MGEQRRLRSEGRFAVKGRFGWKAAIGALDVADGQHRPENHNRRIAQLGLFPG